MIRPSSDGHRLTAHLEPGGPCVAVAERQPDGRWLVHGRAMSHEHAGIALEAAVTVAAASRRPHGAAQAPAGVPHTKASAITAEIIQ
jgi:ribosomal protein S12 methylthiotransferase accessory factor YcaO